MEQMQSVEIGLRVAAGIALLLGNAFFVASEFALTRLRQFDESDIRGSEALERAWEMTGELEIHLTGCQLGISFTSVLMGIVAEPGVTGLLEPLYALVGIPEGQVHLVSITTAVIVINFSHQIWGEQSPTYLGVERPLEVAATLANALYWWTRILRPLILAGDFLAKWTLGLFGVEITRSWTEAESETETSDIGGYADLRREIGEVLARGELSSERRQEVMRALESGHEPVTDIMVDRDDMVTLSSADSTDENLAKMRGADFVRYPVVGDEPEDFLGILYLPRVVDELDAICSGDFDLPSLVAPPLTVDPETSIAELVDIFQANKQELAMVTDEDRVLGLVTSTDAFEYVLGELEDPFD